MTSKEEQIIEDQFDRLAKSRERFFGPIIERSIKALIDAGLITQEEVEKQIQEQLNEKREI